MQRAYYISLLVSGLLTESVDVILNIKMTEVPDLPTLMVVPSVSRFFVITHGLTTRLLTSRILGKNHSEIK